VTTAGRRMMVNGKLLSEKQTRQFEYLSKNSETFRKRFLELAAEEGIVK
jgi:hypothetical protein